MGDRDTRRELLDVAESLYGARGYNGFSYRDLAGQIGIKTASIHYHFPTKGDLGEALVEREREEFAKNLAQLDAGEKDPRRGWSGSSSSSRPPLLVVTTGCAWEPCLRSSRNLPDDVGQAVRRLFAGNEAWLAKLLEEGQKKRQFRFKGSTEAVARSLFSSLEGALLMARAFRDIRRFEAATRWIMETLTA